MEKRRFKRLRGNPPLLESTAVRGRERSAQRFKVGGGGGTRRRNQIGITSLLGEKTKRENATAVRN